MTIETLELGKSGERVSKLGLGTWAWGDNLYWGYGRGYGLEDLAGAFQVSIERGITFLDTAEVYGFGKSERFIGEFLKQKTTGTPISIATKFFPMPWRVRADDVPRALEASLRRLGVKQVTLYQLHRNSPIVPIERWMDGMALGVERGMARAVGVSNCDVDLMRRAQRRLAQHGLLLASNQVEYSLLHRQPEWDGLMDTCRELGITLIAYSPLSYGLLTGKYSPDKPPSGVRRLQFSRSYLAAIQPLIEKLREIGAKRARSPGQVALNWVMQKGALPIPGAKNARQAEENAGALGWQLDDDEMGLLDEISRWTAAQVRQADNKNKPD